MSDEGLGEPSERDAGGPPAGGPPLTRPAPPAAPGAAPATASPTGSPSGPGGGWDPYAGARAAPGGGYAGGGYAGGGYAGGGYGPPGAGYGPAPYGAYPGWGAPVRKTNGMAIASLVVGLGSLAVCPVFAVVGIVLGIIARRRIRDRGDEGAGLALAGLIISSVITGLGVLVMFAYAAFFSAIIAGGGLNSTGSSPRPGTRPIPVPAPVTSTTERLNPPGTVTIPRPTVAPSGVIPLAACPRVTLALRNLTLPVDADQSILSDAARTLHADLPPEYGEDVDTLLTDAISRMGRENTGNPSPEVTAATNRIAAVLTAACPN